MNQLHVQQIECLITLAEELHFGRTAARLGYSQSRASQLITSLECRVGARLVERTSRRVALTRLGVRFVEDVRPAYRDLAAAFARARERAASGALEELRIGFTGEVYEEITRTFRILYARHGVAVRTHDLPLGSPFASLEAGAVDAAIVELPAYESTLTVGFRFPPQDQFLAIAAQHPLANKAGISYEDLADVDLLHRTGDAPSYWNAARTPAATPAGRAIASTMGISTIQQGLALAASGPFGMLVCQPVTVHNARSDLAFIRVSGLEASSQLGLLWRKEHSSPDLPVLAGLLEEAHAAV